MTEKDIDKILDKPFFYMVFIKAQLICTDNKTRCKMLMCMSIFFILSQNISVSSSFQFRVHCQVLSINI